jgi:hypothetical protein
VRCLPQFARVFDDATIRIESEREPKARVRMNPQVIFVRGIDEPALRREKFHRFVFRTDELVFDPLMIAPILAWPPVEPANAHVNERAIPLDHDLIDLVGINIPREQLQDLLLDPREPFRQGWDPAIEGSAKVRRRLSQQGIALHHCAGGISRMLDEGVHASAG